MTLTNFIFLCASVVYLLTESRAGRIRQITKKMADSLQTRLKGTSHALPILVRSVNSLDIDEIARTFIIEGERKRDASCEIVIDLTSGTKEVATAAWDEIKGWKGETWPHRFLFDKRPILQLTTVPVRKLSYSTKKALHKLLTGWLFWNGHAASLLDMISHGEH